MEKKRKIPSRLPQRALEAERARRGHKTPPTAADRLGATEQQVDPLTPPMAESDELPSQPDRKKERGADEEIDPADELTPG